MNKAGHQSIRCHVSTCEFWGGEGCSLDCIEIASPRGDIASVEVQYASNNPDAESMCCSYRLKSDTIGDVMVY